MLEVRLLSKFEVSRDGKTIAISSRPAQSLFAYLILHAGTAHRREKLAGMLWPDSLEETARDNLRHALWRVRKALPSNAASDYLLADDLSISFNASSEYWLDAAELEKTGEHVSADELIHGLSEYHGELLPGFYDEWVVLKREHLQSVFEHKMARLLALLQDQGRWLEVLDWAERWIKLGQKPEPAYRALLSAHAAKGDMSKVAAIYERCVKSLRELGIEPSDQTKELYEKLKSGKETPTTGALPAALAAKKASSNIPVPLTSFIGREKELKEITELLSSSRLLTLTGSGGVGKTRLAIQTAHDSIKKFRDGVVWVDLVGLSDGNLVPQEIAQSLDLREATDEPLIQTLRTYLESKEILLVMDNCEHLIRDCARFAEQLLSACPGLKILATGIEALGLFNETTWQVPSLALPEIQQHSLKELQEFPSLELFDERARNAKSSFKMDESNVLPIAQICRRLDGIPLAIELAAARIKILSVDEIASRLDDRFSLLTAGSRTAIPRHQTLRATINWSYDLLTEPERILLRRLAVFAAGFTLEAAESVCGHGELRRNEILNLLGRLVDKSLVIAEAIVGEVSRYRLLETIRQYALEKLAETEEVRAIRNQHLEFFMKLAEEAAPNAFGPASVRYYDQIDQELDNMRWAMEWAIETRQAIFAFRLTAALFYFWYNRSSQVEWFDRFGRALSLPEGLKRTPERAMALNSISFFYWAGMSVTNPRRELEEALSIGRELGNDHVIARSLSNLGRNETTEGNYPKARSLLLQSLDLWRKLGDDHVADTVLTLNFLGDVAFNQGNLDEARMFYEECVSAFREIRDRNFLAYAIRRLGQVVGRQGEFAKAALMFGESLSLNQGLRDERGIVACLSAYAGMVTARGEYLLAAQEFGAVGSLLTGLGIRLLQIDEMEYHRSVAALREKLDHLTLEQAWAKGEVMTLEQAVAFALKGA